MFMNESIKKILAEPTVDKDSKTLRLALIVGEGAMFSMAKVYKKLGVDAVLWCDISELARKHFEWLHKTFLVAKDGCDFQKKLVGHPLIGKPYQVEHKGKLITTPIAVQALVNWVTGVAPNNEMVGKEHFIWPQNYTSYQKIIAETPYITLPYNITDVDQTKLLTELLKKHFPGRKLEFVLYNPTNVFDYQGVHGLKYVYKKLIRFMPDDSLFNCADLLFNEQEYSPFILYGKQSVNNGSLSCVCRGLSSFRKEMASYVDTMNKLILSKLPSYRVEHWKTKEDFNTTVSVRASSIWAALEVRKILSKSNSISRSGANPEELWQTKLKK